MNNNRLKAFVRFDSDNLIVPSSLILQRYKPTVGKWEEIDINQCCNLTTTTTTTSTSTTTTTTTLLPYFCALGDITIGTQIWTGCNLNVDTYRNGDIIPQVTNASEWANLTTGAWCYYNNDTSNGSVYGKLYNWYAVNDPRGLAPTGYHVPSNTEWGTLITFLGGSGTAGGMLKESGLDHWQSPNTGATNSVGFTALPGGLRYANGVFINKNLQSSWWTSVEHSLTNARLVQISYFFEEISNSYWDNKIYGLSVRLIKD
jgi:uncharacterized protein (TIGR02145 family)